VKLVRLLVLVAAALATVMVVVAYRRGVSSGEPFAAELRSVAGEWSCPALRERARKAMLDGLNAAELRAVAADRELAVAALEH